MNWYEFHIDMDTETDMSDLNDLSQMRLLARNYLNVGDKVLMRDGDVLTVKSLEFREFETQERAEFVSKNDIRGVVDPRYLSTLQGE